MIIMLYFCQTELTIKHNPSTAIYNSTLAKILVEYAAAVSSFTFLPLVFPQCQLIPSTICAKFIQKHTTMCRFLPFLLPCFVVKCRDILQIYTADLTQLFNWTCARCGDLIKVNLHYHSPMFWVFPYHLCNFGYGWWNLIGWPRGSRWYRSL